MTGDRGEEWCLLTRACCPPGEGEEERGDQDTLVRTLPLEGG